MYLSSCPNSMLSDIIMMPKVCYGGTFTSHMNAKSLQSCLTLCDTTDYNPPGSSVHGIFQARILERVAIPFSRGSNPRLLHLLHWWVGSLPPGPPGKSLYMTEISKSEVTSNPESWLLKLYQHITVDESHE